MDHNQLHRDEVKPPGGRRRSRMNGKGWEKQGRRETFFLVSSDQLIRGGHVCRFLSVRVPPRPRWDGPVQAPDPSASLIAI